MFKRIRAWMAGKEKQTIERPSVVIVKPVYRTGRNGTRRPIRAGALVSKKRPGVFRRLMIRVGLSSADIVEFAPYSSSRMSPYVGVAVDDIPKGEIGSVQIAGFSRVAVELKGKEQ